MPFCIEMPEIMIAWSCVWSTFSSWGCLNCTHNSTSFKPCELEINFKEKHILYICWKTLEVQLDLILHFVHHHHHPHRHRHHHHHHHHRCHHHTHLKWQQCYQEIETVMERPMRRCMLLCKKMPANTMIMWIKWWNWYSWRVGWCLDDDWMIIGKYNSQKDRRDRLLQLSDLRLWWPAKSSSSSSSSSSDIVIIIILAVTIIIDRP